jgi:hypothetical protein
MSIVHKGSPKNFLIYVEGTLLCNFFSLYEGKRLPYGISNLPFLKPNLTIKLYGNALRGRHHSQMVNPPIWEPTLS